ncbi:MAG: PAS domain-containing protein [Burkholderiales bacterium]|nr:PAS domain-containing protein [Burkholderiales bacterium]
MSFATPVDAARDAVERAEQRYRALFELSPTGLVQLRGRTVVEANDRAAWVLGCLSPADVIGQDLQQWVAPADRAAFRDHLDAALAGRDPAAAFEVRSARTAHGVTHVNFKPARLAGRAGPSLLLAVRDGSHAHRLIDQIETRQAHFRAIADQTPVLLWMADLDGRLTWLNAEWARLSEDFAGCAGMAPGESAGAPAPDIAAVWAQAVHPDDRARVLDAYAQAVARRADFDMEYRLHERGGSYRWMVCRGRVRRDGEGNPVGFIGCDLDIDRIKQLEGALVQANAELEDRLDKRTADLRAFNYSVSHDLRGPVRSISGFAGLLGEDLAGGDLASARASAARIGAAARRLDAMLEKLLQYAMHAEAALHTETVAQEDLVRAIVDALPPHRADIRIARLPPARCDRLLVEEVWTNLIGNAIKYSAGVAAPVVEIGHADGEYYVRDNGVGFDMADYRRMFGLFARLHPEQDFDGTGAGLAIAKRIVVHHGGSMRAHSAPGTGATFYFTLPAPEA